MIKCGKLKGKDGKVANQCILLSKDGSKALGYFPYSKHGDQKGAKAAAHKREGAIQAFKQKHQGLLDALQAFGTPVVLKYLLDKAADCEACQEVVKSYVETEPEGDEVEKAKEKGKGWTPPPKGWTPASIQKYWKAMGASVTKCMAKAKGHVDDPAKFCASLKDKVTGTTKWRGKEEKKSFDEIVEEALQMLQKDEGDEGLGVDLAELEAWLHEEVEQVETPPEEPAPEPEPEPEPTPEPEPEPEPEVEEVAEELPNDFRTFLLRDHAERQAGVLALLGEEGEEAGDE